MTIDKLPSLVTGRQLKSALNDAGLTQKDFTDISGVSLLAIGRFVRGQNIEMSCLKKIINSYNDYIDTLNGGKNG